MANKAAGKVIKIKQWLNFLPLSSFYKCVPTFPTHNLARLTNPVFICFICFVLGKVEFINLVC